MSEIDGANAIAAVILLSLTVYALTGGADFGGGMWDLLARGPRAQAQRHLIATRLAPVWEANHVWLIIVIVMLFVVFPSGFAAITTALHVPLVLMLVGITLRGAAFVFRAYGPPDEVLWRRWSLVFSASSAATPFLLGVTLGAVSSGRLRLGPDNRVQTDFVSEWLAPWPFAVGLMVVALFAYLAAVYLADDAKDDALREDFRARALASGAFFGFCALIAALASRRGAPHLWEILTGDAVAWLMQCVTAIVALSALRSLCLRKYRRARLLAMAQVVLVIAAWGASQHGWILPGTLRIADAAAPPGVIVPVLIALAVGMVVLIPSFAFLYLVFWRDNGKRPTV